MVWTAKDNRGERSIEGTAKDHEEEFISLVADDGGDKGQMSDALDDEDFITLMPIGNGKEEQTNRGGAAENDLTEKTNGKRTFNKLRSLPPWMESYVDYNRVNPLIALHNEIVGFRRLMEPREEEMKTREELVAKFTALAKSIFQNCKVEVFGSQVTGLCLPTSDIDIAIQLDEKGAVEEKDAEKEHKKKKKQKVVTKQQELNDMENWNEPTGSPLKLLATALREHWFDDLSYLEVIEKTRIPLIKLTHSPTNISIDVCFNQRTGPQAAALMHQYMEALSPLRPLTFVLKKFMASRGLNQPYTGGVGSFLLQMMILTFLQHRERDSFNKQRRSQYNLGALLVEFFEFYSTDFNFILTGVSVRFDGFFFPKGATDRKKNFWQPQRPFSIAMENPLDPTFDVGSPSFRIDLVQRSFEVAFKTLLCHVSEPIIPTTSILASILMPSEEMWERGRSYTPDFGRKEKQTAYDHEPARKRQRRI